MKAGDAHINSSVWHHPGVRMPEIAKRVVSRVGHDRVVMRKLPASLGGCYFPASLEGGAKYLRLSPANADPSLISFASRFVTQGARVWDVGANVGLFTFSAAGLAGPTGEVVAIEADAWLAHQLRRAAAKNRGRGAPVHVVSIAASDRPGVAEFVIAKTARATNYLKAGGGSSTTGGVRSTIEVATMPLDSLLSNFGKPDVVKIDVEGAELLVLDGAKEVLASKPVLMVESFPSLALRLHERLLGFGYTLLDAASGNQADARSFNVIAVPR